MKITNEKISDEKGMKKKIAESASKFFITQGSMDKYACVIFSLYEPSIPIDIIKKV